jgi:hypothetical protein
MAALEKQQAIDKEGQGLPPICMMTGAGLSRIKF